MKTKKIKPPRFFQVGLKKNKIFIHDLMHIKMKPKETVELNKSIKINSEEWGFFIENNLTKNDKLKFIFAGSNYNKIHLLAFLRNKIKQFNYYCKIEKLHKIEIKKLYAKKQK